MLANGEGNRHAEAANNGNEEFQLIITIIKVIMVAIFLVPLADYSIRTTQNLNQTEKDQNLTIENATLGNIDILTEDSKTNIIEAIKKHKVKEQPPTCPRSYILVILDEVLNELYLKGSSCSPDDFTNLEKHKIPKKIMINRTRKESQVPAIVNYAVGIILMTSLGAALVELYKAKKNPEKKDGKHSLSRKCSLADLTVMKHQRKELLRRESLIEVPEENLSSKQMDSRPTPLQRQRSFPVGPKITNTPSPRRRCSVQSTRLIPVVDGRPAAVLEGGRRHSIVTDGRQPLILETRGISYNERGMILDGSTIDDSPERRYHGRRVHRH